MGQCFSASTHVNLSLRIIKALTIFHYVLLCFRHRAWQPLITDIYVSISTHDNLSSRIHMCPPARMPISHYRSLCFCWNVWKYPITDHHAAASMHVYLSLRVIISGGTHSIFSLRITISPPAHVTTSRYGSLCLHQHVWQSLVPDHHVSDGTLDGLTLRIIVFPLTSITTSYSGTLSLRRRYGNLS